MNAIFAVNAVGGFGTGDDMPWPRCKKDLERFRSLTKGCTVVMGGDTWRSNMPKPLPGRRNCVLSTKITDDRCEVFRDINQLLMNVLVDEPTFVIGGVKVLWKLRPYIKKIYLTSFYSDQKSSVMMNVAEYLQPFEKISKELFDDHRFEVYTRLV